MGQPVFFREHWEQLTPFNVLAIYVQPAVEGSRKSRHPPVHSNYIWSLRKDNVMLQQVFANAADADDSARLLAPLLPSLTIVSSEPFIAVRRNAITRTFSDQTRAVFCFGESRSFYVQHSKEYLAEATVKRARATLQLGD